MASADYSLRGAIAVITLNNPPVNALGLGVRQGVADAPGAGRRATRRSRPWCSPVRERPSAAAPT